MRMEFDHVKQDPSAHYDSPRAIIDDSQWSHDEKIQLLEQWEYDAREMEVAAGENMGDERPGEQSPLAAVQEALRSLKEKQS